MPLWQNIANWSIRCYNFKDILMKHCYSVLVCSRDMNLVYMHVYKMCFVSYQSLKCCQSLSAACSQGSYVTKDAMIIKRLSHPSLTDTIKMQSIHWQCSVHTVIGFLWNSYLLIKRVFTEPWYIFIILTLTELCNHKTETLHFVDEPESEYLCQICTELLTQPFLTDCGHYVCQACREKLLTSQNNECPICREPNMLSNARLNRHLQRQVNSIKVRCRHHKKGCEWVEIFRTILILRRESVWLESAPLAVVNIAGKEK